MMTPAVPNFRIGPGVIDLIRSMMLLCAGSGAPSGPGMGAPGAKCPSSRFPSGPISCQWSLPPHPGLPSTPGSNSISVPFGPLNLFGIFGLTLPPGVGVTSCQPEPSPDGLFGSTGPLCCWACDGFGGPVAGATAPSTTAGEQSSGLLHPPPVGYMAFPFGCVAAKICPSTSRPLSGLFPTYAYRFSVAGMSGRAYGTGFGSSDQSGSSQRPSADE